MKVRFQADADLKHAIVSATLRREPMIDFQTAISAGLAGRDDLEVLGIAARRLLITHAKERCQHTSRGSSPATQAQVSSLRRSAYQSRRLWDEILLIWFASDADEWINRASLTCPCDGVGRLILGVGIVRNKDEREKKSYGKK